MASHRNSLGFGLMLLLVLFPLLAGAQAFTPRRPFIPTQPASQSFLANIWHYWVSADLPTNTVVGEWHDRYSTLILSNSVIAKSPTNYGPTNGVLFDGSTMFLTNVPSISWVSISNRCYFYVAKAWAPINTWAIAFPSDNNDGHTGNYGVFYYQNHTLWYNGGSGGVAFGHYADGVTMDFEINSTLGNVEIYTNGVLAASGDFHQPVYNGTLADVQQLGWFYKGFIMEVGMSTNIFTAQNIADYHTYATNTYKFSP